MAAEAAFVTWITSVTKDVQTTFPGGSHIISAVAEKLPTTTTASKGLYNLAISATFSVKDKDTNFEVVVTGRQDSTEYKYGDLTESVLRPGAVKDASKIQDPAKIEDFNKTLKDYVSFRLFKFGGAPNPKRPNTQPYYEFLDFQRKPIGTKVYGANDLKPY